VTRKKFLQGVGIAFLIFFLLSSPKGAAGVVNNAFARLADAGNSLTIFVNELGK
jgi:hypothetical protein